MERKPSRRHTILSIGLATATAILGSFDSGPTQQTILDKFSNTSLPPRTTLLLSGTSDTGAQELCSKLGFDIPTRTSPSSFICGDYPAIQPSIPIVPNVDKIQSEPIVHTVKEGDTFSRIIEQQFGPYESYGEHFAATVLANADLLSRKSTAARRALEMIKEHPEWTTPRTSLEAWRAYMRAAGLINPGDGIILQ